MLELIRVIWGLRSRRHLVMLDNQLKKGCYFQVQRHGRKYSERHSKNLISIMPGDALAVSILSRGLQQGTSSVRPFGRLQD